MTGGLPAIPVEKLRPNPKNPAARSAPDPELAASILALGRVLQPLVVQQHDGGTWLVLDGHRRLAAAKSVGVKALPCLAQRPGDDDAQLATMLAASMHERLDPMDQARMFKELRRHMDVRSIAARTGHSVQTVSDRLRLLALPAEAQQMVERKELTVRDATALAREVEKSGTGSAPLTAPTRSAWFTKRHPLAERATARCDHAGRVRVGGVACGQCWEDAIRDDQSAFVAENGGPA
ncbi:ParB/RepB/Spo0J family partition protein [Cellulosimicrobium cellulans]|uniref:ParB/RepB/Spo0J family partition protein n=1 Tax=Cellulosimicrobium cellulans TaxID=1710 RepID=UPI003804D970